MNDNYDIEILTYIRDICGNRPSHAQDPCEYCRFYSESHRCCIFAIDPTKWEIEERPRIRVVR